MAPPSSYLFRECRWFSTIAACIYVLFISSTYSVKIAIEEPEVQETTEKLDILGVETFDGFAAKLHPTHETHFNNSAYEGFYKDLFIQSHGLLGGARGKGRYPVVKREASYLLVITDPGLAGPNYFGLWLSSFDDDNLLEFYCGGNKIYQLDTKEVGNLMGGSLAYYGNPTTWVWIPIYRYVFVNIFFDLETYDEIRFTALSRQFESDNHSVGRYTGTSDKGSHAHQIKTASNRGLRKRNILLPLGLIVTLVGFIILGCCYICCRERRSSKSDDLEVAEVPEFISFEGETEGQTARRDESEKEKRGSTAGWF